MSRETEPLAGISLQLVVSRIFASRWNIPAFAGVGLLAALIAWLILPKSYVSQATLLPSSGEESSALSGGLLSLAGTLGISVPGAAAPESRLFPAILKSERVLQSALRSPVNPSDPSRGTLFDHVADPGVREERRMERAIDLVRNEILRVGLDEETGIVRVSVRMADPELAARTASVLLLKLEEYLVQERSARSRLNLEFVDSRRTEAQGELAKAESRLKEFRDTNRKIMNSPDLLLDEGRLLRAMRLQEEVFLELTRQHEITKIEAQKATPILEVLDPPTRHHTPDSPKLFVLLGVGLLLGVLAGAASAAVLDGRRPNVAAAFSTMRILWSGRA